MLGKSILAHPSIATFYYAINICGIKLLIFGHHLFFCTTYECICMLLLLLFNHSP